MRIVWKVLPVVVGTVAGTGFGWCAAHLPGGTPLVGGVIGVVSGLLIAAGWTAFASEDSVNHGPAHEHPFPDDERAALHAEHVPALLDDHPRLAAMLDAGDETVVFDGKYFTLYSGRRRAGVR